MAGRSRASAADRGKHQRWAAARSTAAARPRRPPFATSPEATLIGDVVHTAATAARTDRASRWPPYHPLLPPVGPTDHHALARPLHGSRDPPRRGAPEPDRPCRGYVGAPELKRRSSGERTRTDLVRSTNGSPAMRSNTPSKCRISEAKTCTMASASPVTVEADTTSG